MYTLDEINSTDDLKKYTAFMKKYKSEEDFTLAMDLMKVEEEFSVKRCLEVWRAKGLLNCEPTLSEDGLSLVYGVDKYLHWFRGYYFQVSMTETGVGSVITPTSRMDYLLASMPPFSSEYEDAEEFILAMSMLTTILTYYTKTMRTVKRNPDIFNKFLQNTANSYRLRTMDVSVDSVLNYVKVEQYGHSPDLSDSVNSICISDDDSRFAVVSYSKGTLAVVIRNSDETFTKTSLAIPDWYFSKDEYDDYNIWENRSNWAQAYLDFLLAYSGVKANYIVMYPLLGTHAKLGYSHIKSVSKYEELTKLVNAWINGVDWS